MKRLILNIAALAAVAAAAMFCAACNDEGTAYGDERWAGDVDRMLEISKGGKRGGTTPDTTPTVKPPVMPPDTTPTVTPPAKYAVTVTSEGSGYSGGGDYEAGATVTITAGTAPSGQKFKNWTTTSAGVTFANANSAATTFTMPSNAVAVTAVFEVVTVPPPDVSYGTLTDSRDGKTYKTVKIGSQTWMAENLNYATKAGEGNSWCYGDNNSNCNQYGRFYDWSTAMGLESSYNSTKWGGSDVKRQGVCPSGWHLPSRAEWGDLAIAAGGTGDYGTGGTAGTKLKSKSGWNSGGNGTDDFGFSALPGGDRYSDGGFYNAGFNGDWWTATEYNSDLAYGRGMHYYYDGVNEGNYYKSDGLSVRCVQD